MFCNQQLTAVVIIPCVYCQLEHVLPRSRAFRMATSNYHLGVSMAAIPAAVLNDMNKTCLLFSKVVIQQTVFMLEIIDIT